MHAWSVVECPETDLDIGGEVLRPSGLGASEREDDEVPTRPEEALCVGFLVVEKLDQGEIDTL